MSFPLEINTVFIIRLCYHNTTQHRNVFEQFVDTLFNKKKLQFSKAFCGFLYLTLARITGI